MSGKRELDATLRRIPKVDRVLAEPALAGPRRRLGEATVTRLVRRVLEEARRQARAGAEPPDAPAAAAQAAARAEALLQQRACRVVNATGVILHTNLGRAPLSRAAVAALSANAGGSTSIELDLASGRRGARGAFAEQALCELSGAEDALVVNNNAAAMLLVLGAFAPGKGVVVSRGELVEIGGGFRVPEVLARSGARLLEVGTTNKTRLSDYARALAEEPDAALLAVHQSNFRQVGFVERPELAALVALGRERGVLTIMDLGGGALVDLAPYGIHGEPTVQSCVAAGADLVCFSTDKLLGGPQGGAIVGRAELIAKVRRDPLARALRLGRLPLVALEATLASYLTGALDDVPVLAALRRPLDQVRARVAAWCQALLAHGIEAEVVSVEAAAGGGTGAEMPVASCAAAVGAAIGADALAAALRAGDPPVMARIHEDRVLLDGRTVLPDEDEALIAAVARAARGAAARTD